MKGRRPRRGALVPRSLYPFEGQTLDLDGLALHYLDEGAGDPVVMLHGNPTWSFYWRHLVLALRPDHRVIAPDHIGCGLSDKPGDDAYDYTLARRMADLEALLAQLGVSERITLVAHDWGGMIGMAYAVRHPEAIARIVLMNTAAFHLPEGMRMPASLAFVRDTRLAAWLVRRFNLFARGAAWLAPKERLPKELRDAYCAPYATPEDRIATLRFVQDIPLEPGDAAYPVVSEVEAGLDRFRETPILLLWGLRDFVFKPEVLGIFEKRWPHAEVHRFPKAGHYLMEDARDAVPERVRDFLARHPLGPPAPSLS